MLSPMPNLFSYWGAPEDTRDFSRFINEQIAVSAAYDYSELDNTDVEIESFVIGARFRF